MPTATRAPSRARVARPLRRRRRRRRDSPAASPVSDSSSPPPGAPRRPLLRRGPRPHPDKAEKGGGTRLRPPRPGRVGVMDGVGGGPMRAPTRAYLARSPKSRRRRPDGRRRSLRQSPRRTSTPESSAAPCGVAALDGAPLPSEENDPNASSGALVRIGNLGDAGAMIARGAEVVFSTPAQQHEFNCPFQLGWREFYPESDAPEDAETFAVDCRPGDALIMGSDGFR